MTKSARSTASSSPATGADIAGGVKLVGLLDCDGPDLSVQDLLADMRATVRGG